MVDRITMSKGVFLGYGNPDDMKLVGRAFGYDIYVEKEKCTSQGAIVIWVYDRNVTKKIHGETRLRIAAAVELSKERNAWHVDMIRVDSRYKGQNLAVKLYRFLMRKMVITMKAGSSQSAGGRYVWNKLAKTPGVVIYAKKSPYSKVIDFPKAGKRELTSKVFDLYDSGAEIFAVAG